MMLCCTGRLIAAMALLSSVCCADEAGRVPSERMVAGMQTCTALRNEAERLDCYDRLAAALGSDAAAQQPDLSAKSMFGMQGQLSRKSAPQQAEDREEIRAMSALVTALSRTADGSLLIETDQGHVWLQQGDAELMLVVGDTVTISRAALSSFRLSTPTKRQTRVKRVK